ncbi:MAG: DUF4105 domain-containing protein [Ferrimonas sp.]
MKLFVYLATFLSLFGLTAPTYAHTPSTSLGWASDPYWLKLGHYLPAAFGTYKSTIDSSEFFLSPQGKHDPAAELDATLRAFYHADATTQQQMRCAYPARFTWLEQQQGRQTELRCPELQAWQEVLNPESMTLVFPTAFMNNPSSMFGHTLLRIDAKAQTRNQELMAFAINFAAEPDSQDNAALYALKGLMGYYPGRFSVMPYYRKVREYNDIESRDIWEYKLRLSPAEVQRILLHLWEMQRAEFDYYFFDENCSYQLLALLELARDDLFLVKHFPTYAIPADTVTVLAEQQLLETPNYRAAFGTRLLHQSKQLKPALFEAAQQAKDGHYPSEAQFTATERAAIFEFAYEWLNFELYDQHKERDPTARQLTQLLYQRSQIKQPSPLEAVPTPMFSPEQGHGSSRLGLGYQQAQRFDSQLTLAWRPAYHDLLDSQAGFIPGAQISFLDTKLSLNKHHNVRLAHWYLLDAMSLAPSNRVFNSLAWQLRGGFDRMPHEQTLAGRWFLQGGAGKAWGEAQTRHFYALAATELSHGALTDHRLSLGAGIEAGMLWQIGHAHRVGITGRYLHQFNSNDAHNAQTTASWHWAFNRRWAMRSELVYQHWSHSDASARVTGYYYY